MSGWITDRVRAAWSIVKSSLSGKVTAAEAELSAAEAKYLPAFHAFVTTEITTLEGQGMTILDEELAVIGQAFLTNGDVGAAIAASVPKVLAEVKSDVAADIAAARNAVYTAIGLTLAQVSATKAA